jgi:uncharacterized membrane protein YjgN (DUF898 family)
MPDSGITPEVVSIQLAAKAHHREDTVLALKPLFEHLRTAYESSGRYAEHAIKSGFILNGGALVLLSGFAVLFKLNPADVVKGLVGAVGAFSLGLVLSCFTCFLAYRSARYEADVATHRIAATSLIYLTPPTKDTNTATEAEIQKQYAAAARMQSKATRNATLAIIFGASSLAAFISGAIIGGWTLTTKGGMDGRPP